MPEAAPPRASPTIGPVPRRSAARGLLCQGQAPDIGEAPQRPGALALVGGLGIDPLGRRADPFERGEVAIRRRIEARQASPEDGPAPCGKRAQTSERSARTAWVTSPTATVSSASASTRSSNPEPSSVSNQNAPAIANPPTQCEREPL